MSKRNVIGLSVFFLFIFQVVKAQQSQVTDTIGHLDHLVEIWNDSTPGGVVTVMRGNHVLFNKAAGLADLEHNVPVTTETIFEAGSVSKQFTAASILMLVEDGLLSLADDVHKYIPELPDYGAVITVKHLLTHTSGLKDWGSIALLGGWARGTKVYTQNHAREIIFRQKTLNFPPGSEYSYSNSNYTLLATLVERIAKQPLADFTRQRILVPAGMTHSSWRDNFRRVVPGRAVAYDKQGGQYLQEMPFENTYGHAAFLTTTKDLLAWSRFWAEKKFGEKITALRTTQGVLNEGTPIEYALGAVFIKEHNGYREVSHSGATAGYRAWLAFFPQKDLSIAILSNNASTSPVVLGRKVTETFLGKDTRVPGTDQVMLSEQSLAAKAGVYKRTTGFDVVELEASGKKLRIKGGADLKAIAPDAFVSSAQKLVFKKGGMLEAQTANGNLVYKKMDVYAPSHSELQEFTGEFFSAEADALFTIQPYEKGILIFRAPSTRLSLQSVYKDAFKTVNNIFIQFTRDSNNNVTGFSASMARAENVIFTKR